MTDREIIKNFIRQLEVDGDYELLQITIVKKDCIELYQALNNLLEESEK